MNVKATKIGKKGEPLFTQFSETVWKSGQPQRYGWEEMGEAPERKKIPAEVLDFEKIKKPKAREPEVVSEPVEKLEPAKVPIKKEVKTVKAVKNGNRKQTHKKPGKRNA